MTNENISKEVTDVLNRLPAAWDAIVAELHKRIIGQDELIKDMLVAILARGHCLLIGVPGLAKTLLIHTFGAIGDFKFTRIQFTPDMMPSDIIGSEILEEEHATGRREYKFIPGPVFGQLILADEINRTPPKTQAALLEAMQERSVTVAGSKHTLSEPFFVLATQNPIEQEGTYVLPEAQLDRFMFSLNVNYPTFDQEVDILLKTTVDTQVPLNKVVSTDDIVAYQNAIRYVHIPRSVAEYAVKLSRATRPKEEGATSSVNKYVRWGASPRAYQYLALAGKVYAVLDGRYNVTKEDIIAATHPVLHHRLILNYHAEADMKAPEDIIDEVVASLG